MSDGSGAAPTPPAPSLPSIRTERLLLRPFRPDDVPRVKELAGEREIAATTTNIPHPYETRMAEAWIESHAGRYARGESVVLAVQRMEEEELVGAIGLELVQEHQRAEMGYWIGKPFWGRGFASEAGAALLRFGFETLELNRIEAHHFGNNPASGRVLEKIGMRREGCRRQYMQKWGRLVDVVEFAILREEHALS